MVWHSKEGAAVRDCQYQVGATLFEEVSKSGICSSSEIENIGVENVCQEMDHRGSGWLLEFWVYDVERVSVSAAAQILLFLWRWLEKYSVFQRQIDANTWPNKRNE